MTKEREITSLNSTIN